MVTIFILIDGLTYLINKLKSIINFTVKNVRIFMPLLIYITFDLLRRFNLELALLLTSLISLVIITYYYNKDNYFHYDLKNIVTAIFFIVIGVVFIYIKKPTFDRIINIVLKNGIAEEIIFRLGMLGVLRPFVKKNVNFYLCLYSAALTSAHFRYANTPSAYVSLFIVTMIFNYLFYKFGIVASIVAHSLWNFYLDFKLVASVAIIILTYEMILNYYNRKKVKNIIE